MRRVCCLLERWKSGGIESFLLNVLTRIDLAQTQVDIVASSLGESIFTQPLRECGVQFFELSGSQCRVAENHRRFRALLKERHYDVLHLNAFQGVSLAYLRIAWQEGVPIRIAHSHNTALRKGLTRPLKLILHAGAKNLFSQYATELWACSRSAAEFLFSKRELEKKGFQFIPNGVDTERFRFDPAARNTTRSGLGLEEKLVIGNVGRLCYQKNQRFLLEVFAEILKQVPNSCLLLVGEGEDKRRLTRKAQRLGVADHILFCGVSNRVERLLWAMDVFVFPSRFEGFGIVAVEAQTAGLHVLCSEHVPSEAYATPLAKMQRLAAGAALWASEIVAVNGRSVYETRDLAACAVKAAGFDIKDAAKKIEQKYSMSGLQMS